MEGQGTDIRVECHAGHRAEEVPRRLIVRGREIEVKAILDRWLAPDHRYFKVEGGDGRMYLIRHDVETDHWELVNESR